MICCAVTGRWIRPGCARCCSIWSATPSSSPPTARWRSVRRRLRTRRARRPSSLPCRTPGPASRRRIARASSNASSAAAIRRTSGQAGLGLGLALCRENAVLMGGALTVESALGVGSEFTFEFPAERVSQPFARPALRRAGRRSGGRRRRQVPDHREPTWRCRRHGGDGARRLSRIGAGRTHRGAARRA